MLHSAGVVEQMGSGHVAIGCGRFADEPGGSVLDMRRHLLRLQRLIENNAADNLWVRKRDLSPHPLNRGEVNLLVKLGQ